MSIKLGETRTIGESGETASLTKIEPGRYSVKSRFYVGTMVSYERDGYHLVSFSIMNKKTKAIFDRAGFRSWADAESGLLHLLNGEAA